MDSIGAEVGQKMRSAIKAKLLELNCYVDDELPDYIMVMVANKRTKSQMQEDLYLFLSTKTSTFVDWLHIVLKKLKEVTVTNSEVYKKATKRKSLEAPVLAVKKEKKEFGLIKEKNERILNTEEEQTNSLTDNLPVNANILSGQRKIIVVNENNSDNDIFDIPLLSQVDNMSNEKDLEAIEKKIKSVKSRLGLLVDSDLEEELPEVKTEKDVQHLRNKRKSNNTNRTVHVESEIVTEDDNKKTNLTCDESSKQSKHQCLVTDNSTVLEKKIEHKRITFEEEGSPPKKLSVLDRLGSKPCGSVKMKISLSEFRKEEEPFLKYSGGSNNEERLRDIKKRKEYKAGRNKQDSDFRKDSPNERKRDRSRERRRDRSSAVKSNRRKEGILSRLGVMSKVSVPMKAPEEPEPEDELKTREVRSMVQVKPRVIPTGTPQPNKNLLLKAVAEAQRSVAQTPTVGSHMKSNIVNIELTRQNEKISDEIPLRKFSQREKNKLKKLIMSHNTHDKIGSSEERSKTQEMYTPKPIKDIYKETPKYVPSVRQSQDTTDNVEVQQQFIVTLDGMEKKLPNSESKPSVKDRLDNRTSPTGLTKLPIKSRLDKKKSPSPIIFDRITTSVNGKPNIPDKLPIVHPPLSVKNKERCKYWPSCRQGDKCEFIHPSNACEMFPQCKFGDKCMFLHPACKFGSSCTKRECPYSHVATAKLTSRSGASGASVKLVTSGQQTCKFFPNCTNSNCQFYHPKQCKFGKYCKNQSDCNFSHHFITNKSSLIWRSK